MQTLTIELTETEALALAMIAVSPQEWITAFVQNRCAGAIRETVNLVVQHCIAHGVAIPSSEEEIIAFAVEHGLAKTAAERQAEATAALGNGQG